jgi:hypothetical protein
MLKVEDKEEVHRQVPRSPRHLPTSHVERLGLGLVHATARPKPGHRRPNLSASLVAADLVEEVFEGEDPETVRRRVRITLVAKGTHGRATLRQTTVDEHLQRGVKHVLRHTYSAGVPADVRVVTVKENVGGVWLISVDVHLVAHVWHF